MNNIFVTRASQRDVKNHSLWMFMDAADSLFVVSTSQSTIREHFKIAVFVKYLWKHLKNFTCKYLARISPLCQTVLDLLYRSDGVTVGKFERNP